MNMFLRYIWFGIIVRFVCLIVLGVHIRHRHRLDKHDQMIIVANHNSHLDTIMLMNLFPVGRQMKIRPVGAMDYFSANRFRKWFAEKIMRIVPIKRDVSGVRHDPLATSCEAIDSGDSLILFPEGTRGEPERLENFKAGIAHLVKRYPHIPVVPVYLHGLGKELPKGDFVLVPFICDIFVGEHFKWQGDRKEFMESLDSRMHELAALQNFAPWE